MIKLLQSVIRNNVAFSLPSVLQAGQCYSVAPRESAHPAGLAQFLEFSRSCDGGAKFRLSLDYLGAILD